MNTTPQVGDTVLYWPNQYDVDAMKEQSRKALGYETGNLMTAPLPATVVCVFGPTCINLRVHADGPTCNDLWATSRGPLAGETVAQGSGKWQLKPDFVVGG
jgi:hypothetical protein